VADAVNEHLAVDIVVKNRALVDPVGGDVEDCVGAVLPKWTCHPATVPARFGER
jgi:hypothetical protein